MKRTTKFLVTAAIAALTFGTLVAVEGPKDWSYYHHHHSWHDHDCQDHNYEDDAMKDEEPGF